MTLDNEVTFTSRHIGASESDIKEMLTTVNATSLEDLSDQAVPSSIRFKADLNLPPAASESEALQELQNIFNKNILLKSFYGQGYHGTFVPPVIQRNFFENPAWYTSYTPYQAEISQGRLEMSFHFQTLVTELTGLPIAPASLLDEATAAAEAVFVAIRHHKNKRNKILILNDLHPQTLDVILTRCEGQNIVTEKILDETKLTDSLTDDIAAVVIAYPDTLGHYKNFKEIVKTIKNSGALVISICDPLALTLLESPAAWGCDIAVGSMQRFGVPMGFGGPHAGFMAATENLTRLLPGRIVGKSYDTKNRPAYRLALQTREQHIRRDKATSNICTAQALLANIAAAFAIWHGPDGLKAIAQKIYNFAANFALELQKNNIELLTGSFFDNVSINTRSQAKAIAQKAAELGYLIRIVNKDIICVNFDEMTTEEDVSNLLSILISSNIDDTNSKKHEIKLPLPRQDKILQQEIFNSIKSETQMMRFLRKLSDKDLSLDRAMIPLGSCTMKLNAAAEMMPLSWANVSMVHPFTPEKYVTGYHKMLNDLAEWLQEITGFSAVSLQPNSGAQGEYAGLLAIKRYHNSQGEGERHICLIPSSAHGTNPASAHMVGMDVIVVKCLENGNIDVNDLKDKCDKYNNKISALMITYPSTFGVFEETVKEICQIVHNVGGQVYFDGANLNALVGLARPADIGADVCHMNLHKTFAIPHGGGGPGMGPIGVAKHLEPFLPGHCINSSNYAVSAAPFGSASILVISWMYIRMMGAKGLKKATQVAILNANYIAKKLQAAYPILFTGKNGWVAHECIIDTRPLKEKFNISVDDVAKRLIDYGFHAPTMSFPVAGTLMIEPTESEPKAEIDRLCNALLNIAKETKKIEDGSWSATDNPLINAPHTLEEIMSSNWQHSYSREEAAMPQEQDYSTKYWSPVSRIDNVNGDRNLICSCPPPVSDL
ncbi:aminomethyl-transferring glycine dehydrogenase [Bartonella sp. DGB1]|uniref:aminomethyl-transferring glycine dehydrogenase n=1 Tax=Bartonella sp. DGB1 TaxID=3239807 RepID=UPI003525C9BA